MEAATEIDDYVLPRELDSRIRLNMQHFTYSKIFGYLLHPSIPRGENLKIADVGTGSGIWMQDLATELPRSTTFHGFDLDLSQATPQAWLPDNIKLSKLDILEDIPKHFRGQFDIVNLRLFLLVVQNDDPLPVLKNLLSLLRPGGWLQWVESSNGGGGYTDFIAADPSLSSAAMKEMDDIITPMDERFRPTWPLHLADHFRDVGLTEVTKDVRTTEDYRPWLAFPNDIVTAVYLELIKGMQDGPEKRRLLNLYKKATKESFNGVAYNAPRITVVGRLPA